MRYAGMVFTPAKQAVLKPAGSFFEPTASRPITANVGASGRIPGSTFPRFEARTISAVTRPPKRAFHPVWTFRASFTAWPSAFAPPEAAKLGGSSRKVLRRPARAYARPSDNRRQVGTPTVAPPRSRRCLDTAARGKTYRPVCRAIPNHFARVRAQGRG